MDRTHEQHPWARETGTPKQYSQERLKVYVFRGRCSILHLWACKDLFKLGKEESSLSISEMIENVKHGRRECSEVVLITKKKYVFKIISPSWLFMLKWWSWQAFLLARPFQKQRENLWLMVAAIKNKRGQDYTVKASLNSP